MPGYPASSPKSRLFLEALFMDSARAAASLVIGTPERVADHLRTYIAAGFTGFTFGNTMLRSIESIGLAGEVLALLS